jgi:hypothetical protein
MLMFDDLVKAMAAQTPCLPETPPPEDREEHLRWCKRYALHTLSAGDVVSAIGEMGARLKTHGENASQPLWIVELGMFYARTTDADGARRWIEGFR